MSGILTNSFPPKSKFSVDDIPDLTGRVMMVTGGNTGIGKETVKALLAHNAKVYIAGRTPQKVQEAIDDLYAQTGKRALFHKLDLADLKSIKASAEEFISKEKELHVLFNNGGVGFVPKDMLTADGYDLQFGTNVLGHCYLTRLLLPTLISTARSSPDGKARVINTSSMMHSQVCKIDYDSLRDGPKRNKYFSMTLYSQSKFGNVLFSNELDRRYGDQGIVSVALHPGNIKSDLQRHGSTFERVIVQAMLHPTPMGALTQLWAGTMPEGVNSGGKYLIPWARVGEASKETNDPKAAQDLWSWVDEQVKNI